MKPWTCFVAVGIEKVRGMGRLLQRLPRLYTVALEGEIARCTPSERCPGTYYVGYHTRSHLGYLLILYPITSRRPEDCIMASPTSILLVSSLRLVNRDISKRMGDGLKRTTVRVAVTCYFPYFVGSKCRDSTTLFSSLVPRLQRESSPQTLQLDRSWAPSRCE